MLRAYDLFDKHAQDPKLPQVTLVLRKRTPQRNIGRILANEAEIITSLQQLANSKKIRFLAVDLAELTMREQLEITSATDILIGVHGAGLSHSIFLQPEAILIEIHPLYRQHRHFRNAARLSGKLYMPIRSMYQVSCTGTSDEIHVDVQVHILDKTWDPTCTVHLPSSRFRFVAGVTRST